MTRFMRFAAALTLVGALSSCCLPFAPDACGVGFGKIGDPVDFIAIQADDRLHFDLANPGKYDRGLLVYFSVEKVVGDDSIIYWRMNNNAGAPPLEFKLPVNYGEKVLGSTEGVSARPLDPGSYVLRGFMFLTKASASQDKPKWDRILVQGSFKITEPSSTRN
jgi:hypothetical protein